MNNRTNAMKKRADTLAEYVIRRCDRLEAENVWMKDKSLTRERELKGYADAVYEALMRTKYIVKRDDGTIDLGFEENKTKMSRLIPTTDPLYPLAKLLFEKSWWIKKCER